MATEALQIADETDVPTITRTLLRTITKGILQLFLVKSLENSRQVIQTIRKEAENISLSTSSLLVEVIGNALRVNTIAGS